MSPLGLCIFFRWAEEEDEIERNPIVKMKPPTVPVVPVPVIRDEELEACEGTDFADYRMRRSSGSSSTRECAGLSSAA